MPISCYQGMTRMIYQSIMQNLDLTIEQAMDALSVPNEDWADVKSRIAHPFVSRHSDTV